MGTERIDIVITEQGSRVVRRNLEDIGSSARGASSGVDFLKRALMGLGAYMSAREVIELMDTYTGLQNRLRATGLEAQALATVYRELLGISNDTRSSLEGSVELYARLSLAARDLGVSQRGVLNFTKSLNQAILLSGASGQEAQAGLIQLSQGLASGTLRGDELRSVLEQLPAVADVIAKELKVTRGELRFMGEQGKITADVVLRAFRNAKDELENRFAKSVPTVSQSFQVLKNNVIDAVGELDKRLGLSSGISVALLGLASNTKELSEALVNLSKVLITAGAAYAVFMVSVKASTISAAIAQWYEYRTAIAAGTAVALGSAEAERQKAAAVLSSSVASAGAAAGAVTSARAEQSLMANKVASIQTTLGQVVAERQLEVVRLQAQINDIGRMQSLARLAELRKAEIGITQVLAREQAGLAAAQAATTAAEQARLASLAGVATAQRNLAVATAAAAGSTSLLGQALGSIKGALASLWAVIAANPLTALLVAIVAAATALTLFRDQINLGVDQITTLGDLFRAFGEVVGQTFDDILSWAQETFEPLINLVKGWVGEVDISVIGVLQLVAKGVDTYTGLWSGAINAVIALFKALPAALGDLMTQALNVILDRISKFVNTTGELLSTVTEFAGLGKIAAMNFNLSNENEGAARRLGEDVGNAFREGFERSTGAQDFLGQMTDRARLIAGERFKEGTDPDLDKTSPRKAPLMDPEAAKKLRNELEQLVGRYDKVWAAQNEYIKGAKLLEQAERAGMISASRKKEVLVLMAQQLRDQLDPLGAINRELDQEQKLLKMTNDQREIAAQVIAIEKDLRQQGVTLTEKELQQLRERLQLIQAETKAAEARNRILEATVEPQKQFALELQALNDLMKSGVLNQQQANAYLVQSQQDLFAGTAMAQDALITKYQQTYDRINQMRQQDLIDEQTAHQLKIQQATALAQQLLQLEVQAANTRLQLGTGTWADAALASLARVQEGFTTFAAGATNAMGSFFQSFTDGFANSVGRAIVYSEDLNQALGNVAREAVASLISALVKLGIQWLVNAALGQSIAAASAATTLGISTATAAATAAAWAPAAALVSLASWGANSIPAMSGITATAALTEGLALASMAGFREGGYTGEGGLGDIAGVVHGKEFVVNAQATAANRPMLEAMNRGATVTAPAGTAQVNVSIENYGTSKDFEVQRLSESEIRIIARDEARQAVRNEAPAVISAEINNPNSSVSKSLGRNTQTQRRRS